MGTGGSIGTGGVSALAAWAPAVMGTGGMGTGGMGTGGMGTGGMGTGGMGTGGMGTGGMGTGGMGTGGMGTGGMGTGGMGTGGMGTGGMGTGGMGTDAGTGNPDAAIPTQAAVQAILNANCTGCHSGAAPPQGLSLVDVRAVVGVLAAECTAKRRILSGSAAQSYLVDKLLGAAQDGACFAGVRMPRNAPALAASDIAIITGWINGGTPP